MVSPIRFSGLASGMDTESMIKDLMKAQRAPLNKLLQKKQLEEWKRDGYREANALLLEFRNVMLDMKLEGTYLKSKVSSSNEAVVSAKTITPGTNTSAQFTVTQLAQKSGTISTSTLSSSLSDKIDPNAKLEDIKDKFNGGASITSTSFKLEVYQADGTVKTSDEISINPSVDSLNDVIKKVNDAGLGVTMVYDSSTDKVLLNTNHTGDRASAPEIKILNGNDTPGNAFLNDVLKLQDADSGKNAKFTYNGVEMVQASNTLKINGMEYTIKDVGSASVTSSADTDAIFDSIKKFVEKYNDIIKVMNTKTHEKLYRDFTPLLEEQKTEMTEKQVEMWEEKAKSGLFRSDPILTSVLGELRRSLSTPVAGVKDTKFDTLSEIGITTGLYNENGKLYIDEKKLRDAINQNGSKVMELFTKKPDATSTGEAKIKESGIAVRMYDNLLVAMDRITEKAGSSAALKDNSLISKSINSIEQDIKQWEGRIKTIENRYWRQFTAMERAIQQANSQSGWLVQQFGGGQ
ncbi:flagellar hook-associated protein 2 [Brevibacillus agri]|uniref:flagellar hook-associated protein 2 n=1 Tax=Brevibacillus agri TaxID=51101 RepID=UPI002E20A017|nr:flagellar hook-associated protein 2 [Brevibacillus agri]MED1655867.1 flagellar hook-associated protein 2 [Brevibacillus agri]MED1685024.1 flagellar hook-associated protein 2 [Brevibacillus agri]MED1693603.1 flagellar hook-associated protein 2 [Brevibacillus agri]MED1697583.1 flagellar hook-associated protein 2 [Brevibacillus agri]